MDLAALIDTTEPVECEYMGQKITAYVYTAGQQRLQKEEQEKLANLPGSGESVPEMTDEEVEALSDEERQERRAKQWASYATNVDAARIILPLALAGWDLGDGPMTYNEQPFPPTAENIMRCPDLLVLTVGGVAIPKWSEQNPTSGEESPTGLVQEEKSDNIPAPITLLSSESSSQLSGSMPMEQI